MAISRGTVYNNKLVVPSDKVSKTDEGGRKHEVSVCDHIYDI